jgi:broad specificity phosphatase PhoE
MMIYLVKPGSSEKTAKYFLDKNVRLILSSPEHIALETAEEIKNILKTPELKVNDYFS